jgi:hypothetical protein
MFPNFGVWYYFRWPSIDGEWNWGY